MNGNVASRASAEVGGGLVPKTVRKPGSVVTAAANATSNATPQSSSGLRGEADLAQRCPVGAGGDRGADLAGDDAEEGHGGGLRYASVQRCDPAPTASPEMPPGAVQDEEEAAHDQRGGEQSEEHPGAVEHRGSDDAFVAAVAAGGP